MIKKIELCFVLSIVLFLTSGNLLASNIGGPSHTNAMLLTSGDSESIRLAAKLIYYYEPNNTVLLDIAAEVLLQGSQNKIDIRTDSMSWLAQLLGKSKSIRYKKILFITKKNIETLITDTNKNVSQRKFKFAVGFEKEGDPGEANIINHSKTLGYIDNAINDLTENSQKEYSPGGTNLVELKKNLNNSLTLSIKDRTNEKFFDISSQNNISHVYNKMGLPDSARATYYWKKRSRWSGGAWVAQNLITTLEIHYKKFGIITLHIKDSEMPLAIKRIITTIPSDLSASTDLDDEQSEIELLTDQILTFNDPTVLTRVVSRIYHEKLFDVVLLDAITRRVANDMHTTDGHMAKAYTHFLKTIGSSGNTKYIPELKLIMEKANIRKVRSWAKRALEMLGEDPDSYVDTNTDNSEEEESY